MIRAHCIGALLVCACARPGPAPAHASPSAVVEPARRTVPIAGGTLRISRDGALAAISDPDRDRVFLVELAPLRVRAEVVLEPGDEPGRITEDFGGRFHVALRSGGAIVTIAESDGAILMRRAVCPAPRGIELDASGDAIHVACAGGELVTFGIFDETPTRTLRLTADLRDVIVAGDRLYVSRFRDAELLAVDRNGESVGTGRSLGWDLDAFLGVHPDRRPPRVYVPKVAWRAVKDPASNDIWMLHQRAAAFPIDMEVESRPRSSSPYGGVVEPRLSECPPGILHTVLSRMPDPESTSPLLRAFRTLPDLEPGAILGRSTLPVDLAISPTGQQIAMVFSGNEDSELGVTRTETARHGTCVSRAEGNMAEPGITVQLAYRRPIAVAWIDELRLAVQYRDPPALVVYGRPSLIEGTAIDLGARVREPLGDGLFHEATSAGLACASCHPEGGDDGHVWQLGALGGARRTQTLGGGVVAPFHWAGDLPSFAALVDEVFVERMGGTRLGRHEIDGLARYVGAFGPPPRAAVDDAASMERGRSLFADMGCAECHSGERFSDRRTHDVGTGEELRTPTLLGLASRGPYFHDGRAPTLESRFRDWHSTGHGPVGRLNDEQIRDLVSYLASL